MTSSNSLTLWQSRLQTLAAAALGDDSAHDLSHLQRVWRNAAILLDHHREADTLVVMAACYLHDLVNLPKNHPERHLASRQAAALATQQLVALDFPQEKLAAVAHAIETHSFSANLTPTTIEAQIVQDADRIDALGAVGLARLFYISARMGSALAHGSDPLGQSRALDDKAYALDHIAVKLAQLPGKMQTPAGRALAQQRLALITDFRAAFAEEWGTDNDSQPGSGHHSQPLSG
ncbi:HD domain-containing protein [Janthinobacterium aquaticum]|uniref:HD domain-containing protein n=1 Tax=Janthinobacterium sp. FT58W TaxID=2654254 RepID=UPI001265596B|nr:HD domain-containing protein [Janthinobacterium sp. FT58W]KAB8044507.1 HD domain-containing protein [Janthinobacterium sp. FT58W]